MLPRRYAPNVKSNRIHPVYGVSQPIPIDVASQILHNKVVSWRVLIQLSNFLTNLFPPQNAFLTEYLGGIYEYVFYLH